MNDLLFTKAPAGLLLGWLYLDPPQRPNKVIGALFLILGAGNLALMASPT